jgi:phage regulator Rha-like protein
VNNWIDLGIKEGNTGYYVESHVLAEVIGREHCHVLRTYDELIKGLSKTGLSFQNEDYRELLQFLETHIKEWKYTAGNGEVILWSGNRLF